MATTSKIETILAYLKATTLNAINSQTDSNYHTKVLTIDRILPSPEQINNFPALYITKGDTINIQQFTDSVDSKEYVRIEQLINIYGFDQIRENQDTEINKLWADVQRAMLSDKFFNTVAIDSNFISTNWQERLFPDEVQRIWFIDTWSVIFEEKLN